MERRTIFLGRINSFCVHSILLLKYRMSYSDLKVMSGTVIQREYLKCLDKLQV